MKFTEELSVLPELSTLFSTDKKETIDRRILFCELLFDFHDILLVFTNYILFAATYFNGYCKWYRTIENERLGSLIR